MEIDDLTSIRTYIRDRIRYEKELYNPLNIFRTTEIPEPKLDFDAMRAKYNQKTSSYSHFPNGYYANQDETIRILLVDLPGAASGIDGAERLRHAVDQAIAGLDPKGNEAKYGAGLDVKFSGSVQNLIEEHHSLMEDLELSTIIVVILCTVFMLVYYRTIGGVFALMVSLFIGTLATFGVSFFAVGYLNANSAFLGSIVIGNGINFGIIYLARYMEERRKGNGNIRGVHLALTQTYTATLVAALAAGLSYGSLMLTSFRGFKQFGVIGLIGMVICWISAYTLLPALLTVWHRILPIRVKRELPGDPKPFQFFAEPIIWLIRKFSRPIWGLTFALTVVSLITFFSYSDAILETNLEKLRDKRSIEQGSAFLSKRIDEVFQRWLSPTVIMPHTKAEAVRVAEEAKKLQRSQGSQSLIASVYSIDDFVPLGQPEKIRVLRQIKSQLTPRILSALSPEEKKLASEFLNEESYVPVSVQDLPPMVLRKFTEKSGAVGNLVLVEPPVTNPTKDSNKLLQFVRDLRAVADKVTPGIPVAGQFPVTADMIDAIKRDGPRATLFAFGAVILLVIALFRSARLISLCLFSLILGVTWMAGVILGFDFKINFLNFIALPITFGIGVDYGVNIFQRYRLDGRGSILGVIRSTGSAVGMASLTTVVGYGSLLIAGNQAFVSFGKLAVMGELTTLLAAMNALPAYLYYRDSEKLQIENARPKVRFRIMEPLQVWGRLLRYRGWDWIFRWPAWWRSLSPRERWMPLGLIAGYVLSLLALGGLRSDHLLISGLMLALAYLGKPTREFLKFLLPVFLVGIVYDSQRFYADWLRGPIHVKEPYLFDKRFFGIQTAKGVLTPNEWWQLHTHPALDLVTGFAYLVFVALFVFSAAYFMFWLGFHGTHKYSAREIVRKAPRMMWTFFWTNCLGYSTYYWYAAAPPWYVAQYGLGPARLDVPASSAGAARFDQILGTHFFSEMYGRAADVFGAIPSLHVAYPLISVLYAYKFGSLRRFCVFFYLLMCFSAVYLNHHYILDLMWGSAYAILIYLVVETVGEYRERTHRHGSEAYLEAGHEREVNAH
ncbi:MAG: MMPL family transporter, partial [Bacteriovoracia bacterium]